MKLVGEEFSLKRGLQLRCLLTPVRECTPSLVHKFNSVAGWAKCGTFGDLASFQDEISPLDFNLETPSLPVYNLTTFDAPLFGVKATPRLNEVHAAAFTIPKCCNKPNFIMADAGIVKPRPKFGSRRPLACADRLRR